MLDMRVGVEAWGDFACFSRVDGGKTERMSYSIPTPSSCRGLLESIYHKRTEFRYQIEKIWVLNPLQFVPLRRNEIKEKASYRSPEIVSTLSKPGAKGRTQRQSICLLNPRYKIVASIIPYKGINGESMIRQFRSRAEKGQCFQRPWFGCREFVAFFEWSDPDEIPIPAEKINSDCGLMLYDVFDLNHVSESGSGIVSPSFFHARIRDNLVEVPPYDSDRVMKVYDEEKGE